MRVIGGAEQAGGLTGGGRALAVARARAGGIVNATGSIRLLPYGTAARRCSLGQRGLSTAAAVASRRSPALVTRISVAPGPGTQDRRQGPHDPELAEGPRGRCRPAGPGRRR